MTERAAAWPNAIFSRLPRSVRGRYVARLMRRAYGVPRPMVLAGIAIVALVPVLMGLVAVGAIIDALVPWGPWGWLRENLFEHSARGLLFVSVAASCIVAVHVYRRVRTGLLSGQFTEQDGTARLHNCPDCGYDQAGTPGPCCPECGCAIAFTRDDQPTDPGSAEAESTCSPGPWHLVSVVRAVVLPGAAAGLAGLLAFGIAHAALIAPIWRRLSGGWPFALLGGVAIAWAFHELVRAGSLRGRYGDACRFGALLWLGLLPMNACGLLVRTLELKGALGMLEVVIEVGLALASGAAMGWLLSRRIAAAAALGAATLALGLASGGPIALSTIGGAAIFAWMLPICILAVVPVIAVRRAAAAA